VKRLIDLDQFLNILPYSSEIFGIYQPLIGWKGSRSKNRATQGTIQGYSSLFDQVVKSIQGDFTLKSSPQGNGLQIDKIKPAKIDSRPKLGSILMESIAAKLPPLRRYDDSIWDRALDSDFIDTLLNNDVKKKANEMYEEMSALERDGQTSDSQQILRNIVNRESATAGVLLQLRKDKAYEPLKSLFYQEVTSSTLEKMSYIKYQDPFERIKLTEEGLNRVALSPIGLAHLFRQYFYEFDTFLGPAVGHVWVSPYTTVELLEVNTRKNIVERTLEKEIESVAKSEKSITDQEELSEAVKDENRKDTKLGATVTANESWVWGSATETGSISLETTQQHAREQAHKHMRQQSEKISTELKENFKTTFKVVTETTELSSKRYVLNNQTPDLANFEIRRKMRHVGVQVQDIGTYLCWQTYVDDPGEELGLANLVHISSPSDLRSDPDPSVIPQPMPFEGESFTDEIWYYGATYGNYVHRKYPINPPKTDFVFDKAEVVRTSGTPWDVTYEIYEPEDLQPIDDGEGGKEMSVKSINIVIPPGEDGGIDGNAFLYYKCTIFYKPSKALLAKVAKQNEDAKKEAADAEEVRAFKEQYIKAAKERIKLASKIEPRRFEDLREEERIVVYRRLIRSLMVPEKNITDPDDRTRHVVAELLNSIFDVDKMLYFVAPEWWRPRLHRSQMSIGSESATTKDASGKIVTKSSDRTVISDENIVGWGGKAERRQDDYYITEDSVAAKFGSSLGWLMQLDGDNMRNAFLNSPWVKAVIPIRPGKEDAALNWLKQVEGKEGIGDDDEYNGLDEEFKGINPDTGRAYRLIEVLKILTTKIAKKHEASLTVDSLPHGIPDPKDAVTSTPIDWVYEHGFYPLVGGFRTKTRKGKEDEYPFEVFDQWVEVVPTDQVAAVSVKYDPKTGRQI
jgi:hypothetical protein